MEKHLVLDLLLCLAEECATPRALSVAILARAGEWTQLLELRVEPRFYTERDVEKIRKDLAVTELLRKCKLPWLNSVKTRQAAVDTFWSCESQCAATNSRLRRFRPDQHILGCASDLLIMDVVSMIRKEISDVLPAVPLWLTPRFSGGATISDRGQLITLPDKLASRPTCYPATLDLLGPTFWDTAWGKLHLASPQPHAVRHNQFFTVPKDNTKDRGCAKEASINVTLQLDTARHLRRGLERWGIDLERNQLLHRELARKGSRDDTLATIDLSNASDTVSRVLVELLLPRKWYELLNSLRATHTLVDKKLVRLEKFSSMGNGFTFELETLIYGAIARVCTRMVGGDPCEALAYGDDIIVPKCAAAVTCKLLVFFGFTPNMSKTFQEGLFRESCGGDYFNGVLVRGHYLKELPCDPQGYIALANGLRRLDGRWALRAWRFVLKQIPSKVRKCRGPEWLGDVVIHDAPAYWQVSLRSPRPTNLIAQDGVAVQHVRAYTPVRKVLPLKHWKPLVILTGSLVGLTSEGVIPRGDPLGYRFAWVPLQEPSQHPYQVNARGPVFN